MTNISNLKPNTRCKNPNCSKGADGDRAFYYSCKFCAREASWKSIACCFECYNEYIDIVQQKRSKNEPVSPTPERTDMTSQQYNELMQTPIEQVKEETIAELIDAGYGEILEENGLIRTLERINEDIDEANVTTLENITPEEDNSTSTLRKSRKKRYNYNDGQENS